MKKSKLIALLPFLAVSALTGCNRSRSTGEITLTIWEDKSNKAVVQQLCDLFVQKYKSTYYDAPNITIKVVEHSERSAMEDMLTLAPTGKGPDIAAVTHNTIANGVAATIVAEATFASDLKERMTEDAISAVTVNDKAKGDGIYGYPITAESQVVMYDDTLISASELTSFETLKESGKKLGLSLTGDNAGYYTWALYTDAVMFGEDGRDASKLEIAKPESIANVKYFYNTFVKGSNTVFENCDPETALNHVVNKRIAGFITSPYMLSEMQETIGDHLKVAPIPTLNGKTLSPFSGYKAYVVSRYSENGALAQMLCEYLTSVDSNLIRLIEKGYLPATPFDYNKDIRDAISASEFASVFKQSYDASRVMPNIPKVQSVWRELNTKVSNFYTESGKGDLTDEYITAQLQDATDAILRG